MRQNSLIRSLALLVIMLLIAALTTSCSTSTKANPQPKKATKLSIVTKRIDMKGRSLRFGGPVFALDANKDSRADLVWKDTYGTFFLLKGEAAKFSVADKASVLEYEDIGNFCFVGDKFFSPDKKRHYILASSKKKLALLDVNNMKLKEAFSDSKTTVSLSGICGDFAAFGSDIDGDGKQELVHNASVYEWTGNGFSLSYALPHRGEHARETAFADINGDGRDEVISNKRESVKEQLKISTLRNGKWFDIPETTDETQTNEIYGLSDIDGDDDSEIATAVTDENAVRLVIYDYKNGCLSKLYSGAFTKPRRGRQNPEQIKSVSHCDINGDGRAEILVTTEDMLANDPFKPGYDVEYRYILFTWKKDKLVKLAESSIINPRVITGKSSFLIINTVPDKGEKLRNIDKIYKKEALQVTEISYK